MNNEAMGDVRPGLARWAVMVAIAAAVIVGVVSAGEAVRLREAAFLLGLLPAAGFLGGILLLGLRPWPAWSRLTGAVLMLASAGWMTAVGGVVLWNHSFLAMGDYVAAAAGGLAASTAVALLFLAGGWVYRDAQRRGLNAGAWAACAILIFPYLIGLIAYLLLVVLRDQREQICAGCGCRLAANLAFCVRCGRQARRACTRCQAPLAAGAAFCGACGGAVPGDLRPL